MNLPDILLSEYSLEVFLSPSSVNFRHQLWNKTLKFQATSVNSPLHSFTIGDTFSTNFAADSKQLITLSINGREVLFSPSSLTFNKLITSSKQLKNESSSSVLAAILIFSANRMIGFQSVIVLTGREWVLCLGVV